jgi:putative oxidoreductase
MWNRVLHTNNNIALTIVRLGLGLVMFPHGAQKMLGWFGGAGFTGTMEFFEHMGIPAPFAFLAIAAEFFGSLGLIFGFLARIASFGVLCNMIVAVVKIHAANGFFMNWTGRQSGEGFEYHILAIAIALAILIRGAGPLSVDLLLNRRKPSAVSPPSSIALPRSA